MDARHGERLLDVHGRDRGVCKGAAHNGEMKHPVEAKIVQIAAVTNDERRVFTPEDGLSDERHRPHDSQGAPRRRRTEARPDLPSSRPRAARAG